MKKVKILFYIIIFAFTCLFTFGQTKKGIDIKGSTKNELNLDSILKFKPTSQAIMDSIENIINPYYVILDYDAYSPETQISNKEYSLFRINHFRCEKEMNLLLHKYKLSSDSVFSFTIIDDEQLYKKWDKRRKLISEKFGKNFIDSLIDIAERHYVQNNISKVFDFEECDTISRYFGDKYYKDFFRNPDKDFFAKVKYPKDFEYRKEGEKYSWIEADFILHKNGKVSDIKTSVTFQNNQNNKYSTYFRKKLIKFINKSKWVPAKSAGITVTSEVPLIIHFK